MTEQEHLEFKEYFLLSFTKAILNHLSEKHKQILIEKNLFDEKKSIKGKIEDSRKDFNSSEEFYQKSILKKILEDPIMSLINSRKISSVSTEKMKNIPVKNVFKNRILKISEPKLPSHLQYLQPIPVEKTIELGKIEALIKDSAVKIIECHGPDERIKVKGLMGSKPTSIILNEEEIKSIIKEFSKKSKIPIHEGVYRVAVGCFVLSAIISNAIPPKFIIEKMKYPQQIKHGIPRNAR
jgi:hypothetical protein